MSESEGQIESVTLWCVSNPFNRHFNGRAGVPFSTHLRKEDAEAQAEVCRTKYHWDDVKVYSRVVS